jgi:RNA polymerase sigma-54 factor
LSKFDKDELEIGEFIIGNIGDDGYLTSTLEDISEEFNLSDGVAAEVLKKVQKFDPVGVAARDVKECLLIQAGFLFPSNPLVTEIIDSCLPLLETKDYQAISKKLEVHPEAVTEAVKTILELEPKPGRAFSTAAVHYVVPDVFIKIVEDEFVVSLNDNGLPKLRISYHYRTMLRDNNDLSMDTKGYLQQRLRSALWLIKSIHQRQKTLLKITECIVDFQGDFLRKGTGHLKPLILKDVADKVEVHESTVSRVTTNKYAFTPQGILELKYFFNKGISNANGECIASENIKEKIKKIVASEDPIKPLTDESIVRILRRSNIEIARRTVAKYREMVGILPSSKRRKHLG